MYSYYDYNGSYNETDITNFESNIEYKYSEQDGINAEIKNYLNDVLLFHIGNENNKNNIIFSRLDYEELLDMNVNDNDDNNNNSSIIANLSNQNLTLITIDMDIDNYAFKEYSYENKFNIIILKPNSHVFFDNLTVYGFINYDFIKKESINSELYGSNIYLKIDIPKEYLLLDRKRQNSALWEEYNEKYNIKQQNNSMDLIDHILYDMSRSNIISIINDKYNNSNKLIIDLEFIYNNTELNKQYLYQYGEVYNEIIKLKNGQPNIFNNNNKLVLNALPLLICNWFIFECEKKNVWINSKYNNFEKICSLENIPSILNFALFASIQHINFFKGLYNISKTFPINIIDMFICNYDDNNPKCIKNDEKTYIVLNYKLSTDNALITFIDTNDKFQLNQGDLLIYASNKTHKSSKADNIGYSFIILLDITELAPANIVPISSIEQENKFEIGYMGAGTNI